MFIFIIIFIVIINVILPIMNIDINKNIIDGLYTVLSIIFTIIISLTLSISLENATDKRFKEKVRKEIKRLQILYIWMFVISTIIFCISDYSWSIEIIIKLENDKLYTSIIFLVIIIYSYNFLSLQKLKDSIVDKIHEDQNKLKILKKNMKK